MTTANAPRKRTTPLRAKDVPDIAPRIAPVPLVSAPTTPGALAHASDDAPAAPGDGAAVRSGAARLRRRLTARR